MTRALRCAGILLLAIVAACGGSGGGSAGSGSSGANGSAAVSMHAPSGFVQCPQSGDVTAITDADTKGEWQYQQQHGAVSGKIEVFADTSGDCQPMPDIRKGAAKIIASAQITYKDTATATAAFTGGLFGVSHSSLMGALGVVTGSASGFGNNSVYAYTSAEASVEWLNGTTVTAVIAENLSENDFKNYANSLR